MIVVLAVLAAFPLGWYVGTRTTAFLVFGLAFAHVFTFQTAQLVLEATRGSTAAFGDLQADDWDWFGDTIGYLVVTTVVYLAGLALVAAGHALRRRRTRGRTAPMLASAGGQA